MVGRRSRRQGRRRSRPSGPPVRRRHPPARPGVRRIPRYKLRLFVTAQTAAATPDAAAAARRARAGVLYAGGAFFIWGIVPLYFTALHAVSPLEIICHRIVWSVAFLVG